MKNKGIHKTIRSLLVVRIMIGLAVVMLPFELTDFAGFGGYAGPMPAYLIVMGIMYGGAGSVGCTAAAFLIGILTGRGGAGLLFLTAAGFLLSTGAWMIWKAGGSLMERQDRQPELSNRRSMVVYLLLCLGLSVLYGILVCADSGWEKPVLTGLLLSLFWCVSAGCPVLILMTAILGVRSLVSDSDEDYYDWSCLVVAKENEISLVNDQIEELCERKEVEPRSAYHMMSCLEEVLLRIIEAEATGVFEPVQIQIGVRIRNTTLLDISYNGVPFNPLKSGRAELEEELIGLKMIRRMSLRASWKIRSGENQIKIVM